jgi:hypothetical protein
MPPALPGDGIGIFLTAKNALISGFLALPLILITITGFIAISTANIGMIILLLGQLLLIPFAQLILSWIRSNKTIQDIMGLDAPFSYGSFNKLCAISPADVKTDNIVPVNSYWLAHTLFFMTYILMNGMALYSVNTAPCPKGWTDMGFTCQEPITYDDCPSGQETGPTTCKAPIFTKEDGTLGGGQVTQRPKHGGRSVNKTDVNGVTQKVENRKAQALTSFILTLLVFIILIILHLRFVGCETPGSTALALLVYVPIGIGWFKLAELCSLRLADTFGIAAQLDMPSPGAQEFPYACVNITPH